MTPQALTAAQYTGKAAAYKASVGHANRSALDNLVELVSPRGTERMLDIATGGGHTAHAFTPHVARAVAYDLVPEMVVQAAREGVLGVRGMAEALPFASGSFDLVACRLSAHHFADIDAFLHESRRILVPGGRLLLVDVIVPEDQETADEINRIERLRDPSHGRNLSPSEWKTRVEATGFDVSHTSVAPFGGGLRMEFDDWTRRIGTPESNFAPLRASFHDATPALRDAMRLEISDTITFELDELTLLARSI